MKNILSLLFTLTFVFGIMVLGLEFHEWLVEETSPLGATIVFCFLTALITTAGMAILTRGGE